MNNYVVYKHTTPNNKHYVGISNNPLRRWNSGRGYIKNYYFWRAIKKYGWENITHTILYENLSLEEAEQLEKKLIEELKLTNKEYGYNLREGGNGTLSDESRHKMSISRMGSRNCIGRILSKKTKKQISESLKEYYKNNKNPFNGKHHSKTTIAKLKARVVSEDTKKKMRENHYDCSGTNNPSAKAVICIDKDGNTKEYAYATLASQEMGVDLSSIIKCCKGKNKTSGGYVWKYKD